MKTKFIGTFALGNKVDITDPCYEKGVWCRMTTECRPGTYYGYVEIGNYKYGADDDFRVASISIYNEDERVDDDDMELIGNIGVDAGLAGFFNDKPDYPDDEWMEFLKAAKVFKEDGEFDYGRCYYKVEYGLFSESGFGDGGYNVYANKDRSAFQIVFID